MNDIVPADLPAADRAMSAPTRTTTGLPDAACVALGNEHHIIAVRCWAAGGLSDRAIGARILRIPPDLNAHAFAAEAFARHAATVDVPPLRIAAILGRLACEVPCWPDDPDILAAIVHAATAECVP
jgi:hypothetical protein